MIRTLYSNLFEGLQAALFANLQSDLRESQDQFSSFFQPSIVVVPNKAVEEKLKKELAITFRVKPNLRFITTGEYLRSYSEMNIDFVNSMSSLTWFIWRAFYDSKFIDELKRCEKNKRLFNYLQLANSEKKLELAMLVAKSFITYASYRLDWVIALIKGDDALLDSDQGKLIVHPDFEWQKLLWKWIGPDGYQWKGTEILEIINKNQKIQEKIQKVHIFVPTSIPPLFLKVMAEVSAQEKKSNTWLYLLNPSSEHWFASVPSDLFDWTKDGNSLTEKFLKIYGASTRATVDRLYEKLHWSEEDDSMGVMTSKRKKAPRHLVNNVRHILEFRPQKNEIESFFLDFGTDTLLHRLQSAILRLDDNRLPKSIDELDSSVMVIKAPSLTREIENLVNLLQYLFKQNTDLRASKILVVTPDIEKVAPLVEAVFTALPESMKLPYSIVGRTILDESLFIKAFDALANLLQSRFDINEFESWLEYPAVLEGWELELEDVRILRRWLVSAGYRFGLNEAHLSRLDLVDDGSLEQAIDRIVLGRVFQDENRIPYANELPVFGTELGGFDRIKDDSSRVLNVLLCLFDTLKQAYEDTLTKKSAEAWSHIISSWVSTLFPKYRNSNQIQILLNAVSLSTESIQEALEDTPIDFNAFWAGVRFFISSNETSTVPCGNIVFAPIEYARGIPFDIVAVIGLDEQSGFPGNTKLAEFDLLGRNGKVNGDLARRGDRESRQDNRNVFLDLLLATRKHFILSYTKGTHPKQEKAPSIVITDLLNWITSHANEKERDSIIKKLTYEVPLTEFSETSFLLRGNRFWRSIRSDYLEPVQEAYRSQYRKDEGAFVDRSVPDSSIPTLLVTQGELPLSVLLTFIKDPISWTEKHLKLHSYEGNDILECPRIFNTNDRLQNAVLRREIRSLLDSEVSEMEIEERVQLDSRFGWKEVRSELFTNEFGSIFENNKTINEKIKSFGVAPSLLSLSYEITSEKVKKITDERFAYFPQDGRVVVVDIADSKRAYIALKLYQFFSVLAHQQNPNSPLVDLFVIYKNKEQELSARDIDPCQAKELFVALIQIFEMTLIHPCPLKCCDESSLLLWRGQRINEIRDISEAFKGIFNPDKKGNFLNGSKLSSIVNQLKSFYGK